MITAIATYYTAIATHYTARVGEDQLAQSREDADRESRQQAARVSAWAGPDSANYGEWAFRLQNRSLDPVYDVEVRYQVSYTFDRLSSHWREALPKGDWIRGVVLLRQIAPCTEIVFEESDFTLRYPSTNLDPVRPERKVTDADISYFGFKDFSGLSWKRAPARLERASGQADMRRLPPGGEVWLAVGKSVSRQAAGCGDR
ncbi:hypothetical protein [Streptomyces sp. URMC 125]|uniref:hypothetical protein n=1 Tax=Streptomyces sp. URMC 125 TaxID=3423419 RepID=UPI003F1D5A06